MKPREAVRALAVGRIVIGLALLLAPRRAARLGISPDADSAGASVMARALGVRDAIFGGMVLHTVDHPQVGQRWLSACAVADGVDSLAMLAARREVGNARALPFIVFAGGASVAHAVLSRSLTSPEGVESVAAQATPEPASSPETVYPDGSAEAMRSMGARTEGKLTAE